MNTSSAICPICGEGHLKAMAAKNAVEYKGHTVELATQYSVCDVCGSEQADTAQTRANKRAMIAFKKQVDGLLTGAEVRAIRERLGINQADASRIFGGGPVAFSKYENDDVMQSEAMNKLLRLAAEVPEAFARLQQQAGMSPVIVVGWSRVEIEKTVEKRPTLTVISTSQPESDREWRKAG